MSVRLARNLLQSYLKGRPGLLAASNNNHFLSRSKSDSSVVPYKKGYVPDTIEVNAEEKVLVVSGAPEEHFKDRLVRIYKTPKNAMQSGTSNANKWEMEFDTKTRWENPLMGWASTGDPHSNLKIQFTDLDSAIRFAVKNNCNYYIEPEKKVKPKVKSYGFNFSWNKRSRVSTK